MYLSELSSRTSTRQSQRLHMLFGWVLVLAGSFVLLSQIVQTTRVVSDFTQDYMAAMALRHGQSIYGSAINDGLQHIWMVSHNTLYAPFVIQNFHPPFLALLFVPLTWLPYDVSVVLWNLGSVALCLWIGATILRGLDIQVAKAWRLPLAGMVLCWYPLQAHVALGQVSLLLVACLIGGWSLLRQRRDAAAGVLIGVACMIKLFPGLLLLYLLVRRRWWAAASMLAMLLAGGVLVTLAVGPADTLHYVRAVLPADTAEYGRYLFNYSFSSAVYRLFKDGPLLMPVVAAPRFADALALVGQITVLGALVVRLLRMPATRRAEDSGFALTCVAMLLLSPISWQHIFPVLFLPFGLLIEPTLRASSAYRRMLFILTLTLFSLPDILLLRALVACFAPLSLPWYVGTLCLLPTIGLGLLWQQLVRTSMAKVE